MSWRISPAKPSMESVQANIGSEELEVSVKHADVKQYHIMWGTLRKASLVKHMQKKGAAARCVPSKMSLMTHYAMQQTLGGDTNQYIAAQIKVSDSVQRAILCKTCTWSTGILAEHVT